MEQWDYGIEMPEIDTREHSAWHTDRGTRLMQVTIWQKYIYDSLCDHGWKRSKKYRRLMRRCWTNSVGIVIFDERPGYARRKAYVRGTSIWGALIPGKTYDLECFSRSWKYSAQFITGVDARRMPYMRALLAGIGISKDLVGIILGYI